MGKGAGQCFSSGESSAPSAAPKPAAAPPVIKPAAAAPAPPATATKAQQPVEPAITAAPAVAINPVSGKMPKIAVIFYSTYGHVYKLAQLVKEGVESVEGVEVELYQVAETLSDEILGKMHAPPKPDVPVITPHELPNFDGIIFGCPTRYGTPAAQMKAFFDATGSLWQSGALVGKPVGAFTSTATQNGGIETTILTMIPFFVHQGMVFVPPGYTIGPEAFTLDEVRAGSPYGAATYAGATGARQPSKLELNYAKHQGQYFAKFVKRLAPAPAE